MPRPEFDWVFFDCFNTLIDDFDATGDESGLGSLPEIAIAQGFFADQAEFIACYRRQRSPFPANGQEVHLDERLRRTLAAGQSAHPPEQIAATVSAMLQHWDQEYLQLLRPTPGAAAALNRWAPLKKLGVVSNFFLPHYPARYFRHFKLDHHFKFVLDSAAFGFKKPHPSIFREAMRLAGLGATDAARVLFIGDRLDLDILPAREFGLQVLHFNRSKTRIKVAPTPPDIPVIYDWSEFA